MKGSTVISISALIVSIIALALSVNTVKRVRAYEDSSDVWERYDWEEEDDDYYTEEVVEEAPIAAYEPAVQIKTFYKIEDRYTMYGIPRPDLEIAMEGTVGIEIVVDRYGEVTKTTVDSSSTIKDETIIDECRRSALKTKFNSKSSSSEGDQKGTITFNFVKE